MNIWSSKPIQEKLYKMNFLFMNIIAKFIKIKDLGKIIMEYVGLPKYEIEYVELSKLHTIYPRDFVCGDYCDGIL